jgi:hypothetical protein
MAVGGEQKKASALMSRCRTDLLTMQEITLVKGAFAATMSESSNSKIPPGVAPKAAPVPDTTASSPSPKPSISPR